MNYIKRLEYDNRVKAAEIVGYDSIIQDIRRYLGSEKFGWPNNFVNVQDILRMIEQGLQRKDELVYETPKD